jgi:putative hydrolase of the HAD superfamily
MPFPKAILFDLDDTIISFDGVAAGTWLACCSRFVETHGVDFDAAVLWAQISATRTWYWSDPGRHRTGRMNLKKARRDIVSLALRRLGMADERAAHGLADDYAEQRDRNICLCPHAIETLEALRAMGVKLGMITNGTAEGQRAKIDRFGLGRFFDVCLIEGEVGYGKPDRRIFALALVKLGLAAGDVWMVGDNLIWDVAAPQKMGIYSVWVDYRNAGLPEDAEIIPDKIIPGIGELLRATAL